MQRQEGQERVDMEWVGPLVVVVVVVVVVVMVGESTAWQ